MAQSLSSPATQSGCKFADGPSSKVLPRPSQRRHHDEFLQKPRRRILTHDLCVIDSIRSSRRSVFGPRGSCFPIWALFQRFLVHYHAEFLASHHAVLTRGRFRFGPVPTLRAALIPNGGILTFGSPRLTALRSTFTRPGRERLQASNSPRNPFVFAWVPPHQPPMWLNDA